MPSNVTEREYKAVIRARTKAAREAANLSQDRIASLLGVERDAYKKWENRPTSVIPVHMVVSFCYITRIDPLSFLDKPDRAELETLGLRSVRRTA